MKKLFLFMMAAFAISCSNDATDEPQAPNKPIEQPEMVTISFAMKGDVRIEEEPLPLSRTAGAETESKDLYKIICYYDKERDGKIDDGYGYGVFDNIEDMTISLLTGYKYRFFCTLIKDGKDKIYHYKGNYHTEYYLPFSDYLENKFNLGFASLNRDLDDLRSGISNIENSSDEIYYPQTDRYYGEVTDYSPKEGGVVNIELKRCVFGVKFVVTGVTDGTFLFDVHDTEDEQYSGIDRNPNSSYSTRKSVELFSAWDFDIKADTTFKETLYTYRRVFECWRDAITDNDYSENFTLNMTWQRGNGVTQKLDPLTVTFKRNVLTTVNIRLNGGDTNNSFNLDIEKDEMGEENTDFDIDAGDMTDTPVDPTE